MYSILCDSSPRLAICQRYGRKKFLSRFQRGLSKAGDISPPGDFWCQVSKRSLDSEAAGIFSGDDWHFLGKLAKFLWKDGPFPRCDHSFGLFLKMFYLHWHSFFFPQIPASDKLANKTTFERGQEDHKTVPSSPSHPSPKRHKVRR